MVYETEITPEDWNRIKFIFLKYGFSQSEARWAADNNLDPRGPKRNDILKLLRNRNTKLKVVMKFSKESRATVVEWLEDEARRNALDKGEDANNLFQGASP